MSSPPTAPNFDYKKLLTAYLRWAEMRAESYGHSTLYSDFVPVEIEGLSSEERDELLRIDKETFNNRSLNDHDATDVKKPGFPGC